MMWTRTAYDGTLNVTIKYGVVLHGWPESEIPFGTALSQIQSLPQLWKLIRGFENGAIWFETLSTEAWEAVADREPKSPHDCVRLANRVDVGRRRLRGVATRSKRLRKFDVKTSRLANGQED